MIGRRRNDWIAYCYGTEKTGEILVQDIWFFNHTYRSICRLWKQIAIWNGQFSGDKNYRWFIGPRPNNM
jgi:hypothetical protein